MTTFKPIRVDVVVDTWNLRKQAFDVLGQNRYPSVAGIKSGLADMGFDVRHVYAAVACDSYSDKPSTKVARALQSSAQYVRAVDADADGTLLRGRLTDRSGDLEEKLVDVLCAVQITRSAMEIVTGLSDAEAIVVLSEDIDLTPAFGMARELGVPVYAAANEIVDTRPGSWIVLGDASLLELCGRPFGDVGAARKTTVAKQLLSGRMHRQYEFGYFDSNKQENVFRHRTGVEGCLPASNAPARYRPAQREQFFPVDLMTPMSGSDFPRVRLSTSQPVADQPQWLVEGEVVEWIQPTKVRVRRPDGLVRTYDAAPGTLLPGMRVALYLAPGSRPRLVGATEKVPPLQSWGAASRAKVATVEQDAQTPGGTVRAAVPGLAQSVALLPPRDVVAAVGMSFAVVPREHDQGRVTKVMAVTTELQRVTPKGKK